MRFQRYHGREAYTPGITPRRLSHARKAIEKEKEKWALFPDLQTKETPEGRIEKIDAGRVKSMAECRDERATEWRNARRVLQYLTAEERARLMRYWNASSVSSNPVWLKTLVEDMLRGAFDPDAKMRELERCRLLGELSRSIDEVIQLPELTPSYAERTFVKIHVAREIMQARRPELFPPLQGEGDVLELIRKNKPKSEQ